MHSASPEEVVAFAQGNAPFSGDAFFATFDDGLVDHLVAAREVLAPLGLRAAFFIPTRPLIDRRSPAVHKLHWLRAHTAPERFDRELRALLPGPWDSYELTPEQRDRAAMMHIHDKPDARALKFMLNFIVPYDVVDTAMSHMLQERGIPESDFCARTFLDSDGLHELSRAGHVIGAHGHGHVPLSSLDAHAMDVDLEQNRRALGGVLGEEPTWISYPYGRADALPPDCGSVCRRHGFQVGLTLLPGWNSAADTPYQMRRITPNELPRWIEPATLTSSQVKRS